LYTNTNPKQPIFNPPSPAPPLGHDSLPTFTFRQVGAKSIEFQALPGPEARALRGKIRKKNRKSEGAQGHDSP
jgi:hypothetical protein